MMGLQYMLMQCYGNQFNILPSWPSTWNVDFKLCAPSNTTVRVKFQSGAITYVAVTPTNRANNLIGPSPTELAATPGNDQVTLIWNAAFGASGYNVKRSAISGGPYTTIAAGVSTTSYTNTGLVNGTEYYFVVSATNNLIESSNSIETNARPSSQVPPQLGLAINTNQIQFNWPMDHTGWELQSQTNAINTGLSTNWLTIPGTDATNQALVPVNPANGSVFFRLIYP